MDRTENSYFSAHYQEKLVTSSLTAFVSSIVPNNFASYVVICIGTDRSTGDSLGPLTGSLLKKYPLSRLTVYGTLHEPVHAVNLTEKLTFIKEHHKNSFCIAVDASLGVHKYIGHFHCGAGSLQPGAALGKQLPSVGDIFLSGIVNVRGMTNFMALQSTRLALIYDMATILASSLYRLDISLQKQPTFTSLLKHL